MTEFLKEYKKFTSADEAQEYTKGLDKNNIAYFLEKATPVFDPAFAGNTDNEVVVLKLRESDFLKANKVLDEAQLMDIDTINNEYYLFSFTDDELMDVIVKKEEWNDFDYVLAQKILKERGKEVSMDILNAIRKQREIELSRHLPYPKTWIITGYTFALFGGLISMMIGVQLIWDKKKLPDGRKMYAYDESARNHGRLIFLIGLMVLILTIYFNMREEFYNEFIR